MAGNERRNMFDTTPPPGDPMRGVDPLEALKVIVKEVEAGNLAIKNLSTETFRNPRTFATFDRDFQSLVPGDCFMTVSMEIAPSGRVRDDYVRPTTNTEDEIGDILEPLGDAELDEALKPIFDDAWAQANAAKEGKRQKREKPVEPAKPVTPAGASAAREIIFDDDGSDPT